MSDIKPEGFDAANRRPDFRRLFSDGSMAIATSDLSATLEAPFMPAPFHYENYNNAFQQPPFPFHSLPNEIAPIKAPATKVQRGRAGRKLSMNDVKPAIHRSKSGGRAVSFSQSDSRGFGLGLQTHVEGERTDSVSPPDYPFGMSIPSRPVWDGTGSLPSMQSFGTTLDEAILDSPVSPTSHLPPLAADDEQSKKQRRRECHNQVEKRRREHINAKIEELSHLLPAHYQQADEIEDEDDVEDSPKKRKPRRNSMAKKDAGPCKGRVLTHSVQYIHDLRRTNDLQAARIQQLEALLAGTTFAPPNAPASTQTAPPPVFYSPSGLQQMPASPETEPFAQPGTNSWNQYNAFEPSPDDFRSSSSSSDPRPLPRARTASEMEIQVGLHGMDLESVFASRREDDW